MHVLFRLLVLLTTARKRPPVSIFDPISTPMRAMPTDIDIAMHINNGVYFSLFDLGRFELMVRSGAWGVIRKKKWTPVVQAETVTFRKSIVLNQRFTQETRLIGMDDRCIYFEQRMVANGEIYAQATIATRMVSKLGPVANEEIIAAVGEDVPADLVLPEWIERWREDTALPGARRPAPHQWV
ncbi:acyl-CoA thioesterase [Paeniglutamicibacter sp. NPDC091659]|uniref:acyl-CoA thioesterase n=1 Tax=Paeniglutamicibacter sp. NPDC091659 TaxID=3364389 RepID=UPI0037FBC5E9